MIYDVDYFIRKFEAIPEEMWCTHALTDDDGRHCALGHCFTNHAHELESQKFVTLWSESNISIDINNGDHKDYQQPTPKQRILAALYDIKNKQYPKTEPVKTEVKTIYVTVDAPVRELQEKELCQN